MNRAKPSKFFRILSEDSLLAQLMEEREFNVPASVCGRIRPGDGLIVADWDEIMSLGKVKGLVVITSIDRDRNIAKGEFAPADIVLRPNPSGRRFWRAGVFGFAPAVIERYMLQDLFAEHFPDYEAMDFRAIVGSRQGATEVRRESPGYVYVIHSKYGYKIGRTVNLKQRTQLFAVKLPFEISLAFAGHFNDHIGAESQLHSMFASKRLEGEWFDLGDEELRKIKDYTQMFGRVETANL